MSFFSFLDWLIFAALVALPRPLHEKDAELVCSATLDSASDVLKALRDLYYVKL